MREAAPLMPARRVKYAAIPRITKQRVPLHHAHGCDICGRRFMDSCARPLEQRSCVTCRTGQPASAEDRDRLPKQCCHSSSQMVTDVDTLSKYALAGHTPWFQCLPSRGGCARTHPFDPKEQDQPT